MKILKAIFSTLIAAIISTLVVFLVLEGIFRFIGAPGSSEYYERQIIKNDLSPRKPKDEFRIFMLGESTMHGMQYAPRATIPRWLEIYLHTFLPGKKIKVVNFGRLGEVSAFVREAVETTSAFKPDLLVIYLGNNDFLPDHRVYDVMKKENTLTERIKRLIRKSYFVGALNRIVVKIKWKDREGRPRNRDEIQFERGPQQFGLNDVIPPGSRYYEDIVAFFEKNIESIIVFARKEGIPVIFFMPISSLRLTPHYSLHLKELTRGQIKEWDYFYEEGKAFDEAGRANEALGSYLKALNIDDTYAGLLYRIGALYDEMGLYDKARLFYGNARDYDSAPTRSPTKITEILKRLCKQYDVPLIDTEGVFAANLKGGIPSEPIIEDNCHPSLEGQRLMALAVAHVIADNYWIASPTEWKWEDEKSFNEYLEELGVDNPFLAEANFILTTYLLNLGPHYDLAIRYALRGLEYEPENPDLVRRLAWLYWLKGDIADAKIWYNKLGVVDPEALAVVKERYPEIFEKIGQ